MKKVLIAVLFAALALGISCKKKAKEEAKTVAGVQQHAGRPKLREGRVLAPDKYWEYELQRLTLRKKYQEEELKVLKSAKKADQALTDKITELRKARRTDFRALTEKLDINENDYGKTYKDPAARKEADDYLSKNAELSAKIKQVRDEMAQIMETINTERTRLDLPLDNRPKSGTQAPNPAK